MLCSLPKRLHELKQIRIFAKSLDWKFIISDRQTREPIGKKKKGVDKFLTLFEKCLLFIFTIENPPKKHFSKNYFFPLKESKILRKIPRSGRSSSHLDLRNILSVILKKISCF